MKTRVLTDGAYYGPEALKAMGRAFDAAWVSIAGNFGDSQKEAARLRLANALLSIADDDSRDLEVLKTAAIEAMRRHH